MKLNENWGINMFGLIINKVMLCGEGLKSATLDFVPGLNIIYGPSDCGKTLAADCIDYALGKTDGISLPTIAEGYSFVMLEIQSNNTKEIFSIVRKFEENKSEEVYVCNGDTSKFSIDKAETYTLTDSKSHKLFSDFLLEVINCPYENIYKNAKGVTKKFSIRNFLRIAMLNETRIDEKYSVFLVSASKKADFKNLDSINTANVFLTGIKLETVDKIDDINKQKAKKEGMILGIQETLLKLQEENGKFSQIKKNYDFEDLNGIKIKLNRIVDEKKGIIENLSKNVTDLKKKLTEYRSRYVSIRTEINKFLLLKESYVSDKYRLEFIDQANEQDDEMLECQCPICNSNVKIQKLDIGFRENCIKEIKRLNQLIAQIEYSVGELHKEQEQLERVMQELTNKINQAEEELSNGLVKDIENLVKELNDVSSKIYIFQKYVSNERLIKDYNKRINELKLELKTIKKQTIETSLLTEEICRALGRQIKDLIINCQLADKEAEVLFEKEDFDIKVNGQKKESFGSGVRGVLNSLVSSGIMLYCASQDICHPGFLLFDSPICKYYDQEDKERTVENIDQLFYNLMRQISERCQIIIFENRKPENIQANIIHFTKNSNTGRVGFIEN